LGPLVKVLEIDLLENGDPAARNAWVSQQVFNLMSHARAHSKFWAKRLHQKALHDLTRAPVLSKRELVEQVGTEGCLPLGAEHGRVTERSTSGSTGTATRFFVSDMNLSYNLLRGLAQYLFDGQSLMLNRVSLKRANVADKTGYKISEYPHWIGPLAGLCKSGRGRVIEYQNMDSPKLVEDILRYPGGYLSTVPSALLSLSEIMGEEKFRKWQVVQFLSKRAEDTGGVA
jgi:hypothetical protein